MPAPTHATPPAVSQAMLDAFVQEHRLQRATLAGLTFFMNPDITLTNQWLTNVSPTGSGYVRWSFGAQPYSLRLEGTPGVVGYNAKDPHVAGIRQLLKACGPGWNYAGNHNQNRTYDFAFPAFGLTAKAFVDSFTRSMTSQHPLYTFFSIILTIMPPRIARDYQPFVPNVDLFPKNPDSGDVPPRVS